MKPVPKGLQTYINVVATAGAAVLVMAVVQSIGTPPLWLALAATALLAGSFRLKFASVSANIAIDDVFLISTSLLFGPGPGTIVSAACGFLSSWRRSKPLRYIAFNTAALALSMWGASQVFFAVAGVAPLAIGHHPIVSLAGPLSGLTVVYFLLNSGLTAVAVGLDSRQSPIEIWKNNFRWLWVGYLGAASVAFCLILLLQQQSVTAAAMVLPLLAVFHLTLRSSFGRLDDARRHLGDMDRLYLSTVETLAMAIDAKDDVTHSHVRRVQAYAVGLARALDVSDELALKAIEAAALLHDTGKLAVPEYILNKPGKLTASEFEKMKLHVDVGADILSLVEFPYPVVPIVRCHHESWDGGGYPRGIRGEAIPIGARILSVVDCFDALTSDRPYRRAMTEAAALDILRERRGTMYDPNVVDTFIRVYRGISVTNLDAPAHREVMQRVTQGRNDPPAPEPAVEPPSTSRALLAFVSLSRVASGECGVADVFALGSRLLSDIVPTATGAWYVPDPAYDRLVVADAFGPAAHVVRGASVNTGERLTGWVAAHRQAIVNSDAMLDIGARTDRVSPSLESCMSVPLVAGDSLVAVLSLYAPGSDAFGEDRGRLIQMVAPHLAVAIAAAGGAASRPDLRALADSAAGSLRLVAAR
ncbi:MAG TPA: HD domain-containing phosphohydrolase [Vicinamibacterales bacterium]